MSTILIALNSRIQHALGRLIFGKTRVIRPLPRGPFNGSYQVQSVRWPVARHVELEGWLTQPVHGATAGVLLYFGGRNENVAWAVHMASYLQNWAVYAFNYRGMGQSDGSPDEPSAKADALQLMHTVLQREAVSSDGVAVLGRSLGCAIALSVAAHFAVGQLVLLTPFDRLVSALRGAAWWRHLPWYLPRQFDNLVWAQRVRSRRTAVFVAEQDLRVPRASTENLAAHLARLDLYQVVPNTSHQSLPRSASTQALLAEFLTGISRP